MTGRAAASLLLVLAGCASGTRPNAAAGAVSLAKPRAVSATPAPRGLPTWLPTSDNAEEGIIEGVPLIAVEGTDLVVDGLRVGEVLAGPKKGKPARLLPLFEALRSRREAWLGMHPGESWPGVVAYRFGRLVPASVVKSVVLTAGYAACPNGSFLVETRGEAKTRVGRLAVDPLMMTEPDENILTVEVKSDAFVVSWKATKGQARTKVLPRAPAPEPATSDLAALASEVGAMWEASGLHRAPNDERFDQAVIHVEDEVPYEILVGVVDALYAPRRSIPSGRRSVRVSALNVNLAGD
jgi:hypothetical protein